MRCMIAVLVALAVCLSSGTALANSRNVASNNNRTVAVSSLNPKVSKISYPNRYPGNRSKKAVIPAYWVYRIIRCGGGGYLGYISSAGWKWYERAVSVTFGCILAV